MGKGVVSHEKMMSYFRCKGRDNARTPMQWDDSVNAGFTSGTPWLAVNPNYPEINAEAETADEDSVFHYYRKLINLRKNHDIIVYGRYEVIMEDDSRIFAYIRRLGEEKLLVLCNFSDQEAEVSLSEEFREEKGECLIHNYDRPWDQCKDKLLPYEAVAITF